MLLIFRIGEWPYKSARQLQANNQICCRVTNVLQLQLIALLTEQLSVPRVDFLLLNITLLFVFFGWSWGGGLKIRNSMFVLMIELRLTDLCSYFFGALCFRHYKFMYEMFYNLSTIRHFVFHCWITCINGNIIIRLRHLTFVMKVIWLAVALPILSHIKLWPKNAFQKYYYSLFTVIIIIVQLNKSNWLHLFKKSLLGAKIGRRDIFYLYRFVFFPVFSIVIKGTFRHVQANSFCASDRVQK